MQDAQSGFFLQGATQSGRFELETSASLAQKLSLELLSYMLNIWTFITQYTLFMLMSMVYITNICLSQSNLSA